MAKTESSMLALGTLAPQFSLPDVVSGQTIKLSEVAGQVATVIFFICNHCPYVKHVNPELPRLAHDYLSKGVTFLAINANDASAYPEDSVDNMIRVSKELGYPFPYLFDETQEVARAYDARCTPDFYVFDKQLSLVYRGQLDGSRLGNSVPLTGKSIRTALDCLLNDMPVPSEQHPSLGCNIKFRI